MECINITSMDKNIHFLSKRAISNAITSLHEHKMKPGEVGKVQEKFKEAGLTLDCGPSDRTTKLPTAGVGMIVKNDLKRMTAERRCEAFKERTKLGRWTSTSSWSLEEVGLSASTSGGVSWMAICDASATLGMTRSSETCSLERPC